MSSAGFPILTAPRSRVFISCGQRHDSDEIPIAREVAQRLASLGYEPYLATEEQTLSGLSSNLFGRLEKSEYFLFIDFKREAISSPTAPGVQAVFRGSLFSHQELAVAAFLNLDVIALQEDGVRAGDGILAALQVNAHRFRDRSRVADLVVDLVTAQWRSGWRRELVLEREPGQFVEADTHVQPTRKARFFHVLVRNLDQRLAARNCRVLLEHLALAGSQNPLPVQIAEFKWEGSPLPAVTISAGSHRSFDAIWFPLDGAGSPQFNVHADSTRYYPRLPHAGEYTFMFRVEADNMPPARGRFRLVYGERLEDICLEQEPMQQPSDLSTG